MKEIKTVQPSDRLCRMHDMFAKNGAILAEDYQYFTRQDVSTRQNKAAHKSAKVPVKPVPKPN